MYIIIYSYCIHLYICVFCTIIDIQYVYSFLVPFQVFGRFPATSHCGLGVPRSGQRSQGAVAQGVESSAVISSWYNFLVTVLSRLSCATPQNHETGVTSVPGLMPQAAQAELVRALSVAMPLGIALSLMYVTYSDRVHGIAHVVHAGGVKA